MLKYRTFKETIMTKRLAFEGHGKRYEAKGKTARYVLVWRAENQLGLLVYQDDKEAPCAGAGFTTLKAGLKAARTYETTNHPHGDERMRRALNSVGIR
jgi:hypothetical protein